MEDPPRVDLFTPFSDDYREPVQETPEQRLRSTILKLGEVVRLIERHRKVSGGLTCELSL